MRLAAPSQPRQAGRGSEAARRERRQFITHNMVAAAGTWSAGILGLLLQAMVSHHFRPELYGQAFAVFSFYTVLTQPAAGFSRMIAWSTSRLLATKGADDGESSALLRTTNFRLLAGGTLLGLAFIAAAPLVSKYLNVPASFVILGAVGVPFMFATSPLLASIQGEQRWVPWSALSMGIALSRVVFVAIFTLAFGIAGVMLGISVAAAVLYLVNLVMVWPRIRRGRGRTDGGWRKLWRFLVLSVASTVTIAVLMGSDVILVEHFFSSAAGGQFSAVTVTSRALFFAMGSVTSVLFPKVAARHASSRGTRTVVAASVGVALVGGLLGLLVFSAASHFILRSFSGAAYEAGSSYIGWYALGMPLLAAVVMLSNTQQSLEDLGLLWVLVPGALIKPVLILFFHKTLLMVAVMSDISIAVLLLALATRYILWERRRDQSVMPVRVAPGAPDEVSELVAAEAGGLVR